MAAGAVNDSTHPEPTKTVLAPFLLAWVLTSERPLLTMHARVRADADRDLVLRAIRGFLEHEHGIGHATIQIEPAGCADEDC